MLKMAEAEEVESNAVDDDRGDEACRQHREPSKAVDFKEDHRKDATSDPSSTAKTDEYSQSLAGDTVNNANNICEQCEAGVQKTDPIEDCKDRVRQKEADNIRTAGSGCSSPASSTVGVDHDLRLPVDSPGAWSPSGSQIHYVTDSPLTPTRFRSKSEADTSTNPVHAQAIVGTSVRPKERRASSTSSVGVESPRGEPAGSASGSLSLHGTCSSTGSSTCPTPSSAHSRTPSLSPSGVSASAIPPVDPSALADIERHCKRVADNVDLMMGHLSSTLQNMSAITVGHTQTYRDAVDKAGVTVDQSVKCMYALIARCEELNKTMEPVHRLANQIKSIKRLLEEMEAAFK